VVHPSICLRRLQLSEAPTHGSEVTDRSQPFNPGIALSTPDIAKRPPIGHFVKFSLRTRFWRIGTLFCLCRLGDLQPLLGDCGQKKLRSGDEFRIDIARNSVFLANISHCFSKRVQGGVVSGTPWKERAAVSERKEDPSEPAYRRTLQTAVSCCRPMAMIANVTESLDPIGSCVGFRDECK
jgi:hypothetical protein